MSLIAVAEELLSKDFVSLHVPVAVANYLH